MKILIISPGKKHEASLTDAIELYEKRLSKQWAVAWEFPSVGTKEEEGLRILKQLKEDDLVVLLDERGADVHSEGFAQLLARAQGTSVKRVVFVIGGAYGVSSEVSARADLTLKLSSLVFPHMLVRLILMEQLYRAHAILSGSKYHHA